MKALEFETTLTNQNQIALPAEFAGDIPAGQPLRVMVMWESESVDSAWRAAGRRKFEEAYAPEDVIYEQLIDDTPVR